MSKGNKICIIYFFFQFLCFFAFKCSCKSRNNLHSLKRGAARRTEPFVQQLSWTWRKNPDDPLHCCEEEIFRQSYLQAIKNMHFLPRKDLQQRKAYSESRISTWIKELHSTDALEFSNLDTTPELFDAVQLQQVLNRSRCKKEYIRNWCMSKLHMIDVEVCSKMENLRKFSFA